MEEEGSWPRLGLPFLPGVAVGWLVLCLLVFLLHMSLYLVLHHASVGVGSWGGFIDQPTQGYNGNTPSRWVRIVGARDTRLAPAEGSWFAGFP